jgi:hypothetical protein
MLGWFQICRKVIFPDFLQTRRDHSFQIRLWAGTQSIIDRQVISRDVAAVIQIVVIVSGLRPWSVRASGNLADGVKRALLQPTGWSRSSTRGAGARFGRSWTSR